MSQVDEIVMTKEEAKEKDVKNPPKGKYLELLSGIMVSNRRLTRTPSFIQRPAWTQCCS